METGGDETKIKPKYVYTIEDEEIKKIELEKDIVLRMIKNENNIYVDIRKFYKGYPTKKGIRITKKIFDSIKEIL